MKQMWSRARVGERFTMSVVLVVEDDLDISELLVEYLSALGYHVYPVEDGRKVIKQAHRVRPKLILLDMNYCWSASNDIARALRADPGFATTPIVLVSEDVRSIRQSREWHPDGIVPKPFGMQQLKATLQGLIGPASLAT